MWRGSRRGLLLAVMAVCLTPAACHHGGSVGAAAAETNYNGAVTVRVVNHNWLDITVYLLQGTRRDRIGVATATSTTEFHVALRRMSAGTEYRLLGDPIGARETVRSEPLHAQDGDVVTWTLEDNLNRSSIDVR
jgi:hypothetical protein